MLSIKNNYIESIKQKLTDKDSLLILKQDMVNSIYKEELDVKKEKNERYEMYSYTSFSDMEMLYYYIHYETNLNPNKNKSKDTKMEYTKDILQFLTFVTLKLANEEIQSNSILKSTGKRHIEAYQKWLVTGSFSIRKNGYAPSTISRKTTVVKGFLEWVFNEEYIDFPLHAVFKKATVRQDEKPERSLQYEEVRQLLDYYKSHEINHALLLLLATTGARINEVCKATWGDIYYDPTIKGGSYFMKVKVKGKNRYRHIYLLHTVIKCLLKMKKRRGLGEVLHSHPDITIFVTNRLKPYPVKYLSNYVISIIEETRFEWLKSKEGTVSPPWFRHYFANHLHLDLKVDLTIVQKTVGHQSRSTTEGYVNKQIQKEQDAGLLLKEDMYM